MATAAKRPSVSMPKRNPRTFGLVGAAAFAAGYVLSVIAGLFLPENGGIIATLVVLGVVVGAVNITGREIVPYLVAAIALVLIGNTGAFLSLNLVIDGLGERANAIVRWTPRAAPWSG